MAKVKVCKTCGTEGDPQNKLCIQGTYTISYCWKCMNEACKKAAEDPTVKKLREAG